MLESGPSGSVRGVPSNGHPYRDPGPKGDIPKNLKRTPAQLVTSKLSKAKTAAPEQSPKQYPIQSM